MVPPLLLCKENFVRQINVLRTDRHGLFENRVLHAVPRRFVYGSMPRETLTFVVLGRFLWKCRSGYGPEVYN